MDHGIALLMFPALLVMILLGYPVAFTLAGVAMVFAALGSWLGIFSFHDLGFVPLKLLGIMQNTTLLAVPLFVFMGLVLEKSKLAEDLLKATHQLFAKLGSSMPMAVVLVGALLAASTGIVGATVVTMGVLALPSLLKKGYPPPLSAGVIAASGTLGQIIPPSIVLILLGDMMSVDVGDLFIGALVPGMGLVGLYLIYLFVVERRSLRLVAEGQKEEPIALKPLVASLLPAIALMILVLGSILGGIASPTEAAGCGALGALGIAGLKKRWSFELFRHAGEQTAKITAMVFFILVGAQFFGVVFRGLHGDALITEMVLNLELPKGMILVALMALLFVLGFFLDFLEICFIVVPIIQPILTRLGFDPLWIAILIALNLQTSFLTPPFGFALFYLKGVAPKEVTTRDLYLGVSPFIALQVVLMVLVASFPALVTYLPKKVF